jgi:hypothetical protein
VDEHAVVLHAGDEALLGARATGDPYPLVQLFRGERFIRPGRAAEARLEALQTPMPEGLEARMRRSH